MSAPDPELIRAANWLTKELHSFSADVKAPLRVVLAALPEEVTNPKLDLPGEPGWYKTPDIHSPIELEASGVWLYADGDEIHQPERLMPLTRLVPEKPPVTGQELRMEWLEGARLGNAPKHLADYVNGDRA
jgi:hypothetical protein